MSNEQEIRAINRLMALAEPVYNEPTIQATYQVIRFCPNLRQQEFLNIGVVIDYNGKKFCQIISLSILEKIYKKEFYSFQDYFINDFEVLSIMENFIFGKIGFVQGTNIEQMLDELFKDFVPLSIYENQTNKTYQKVKSKIKLLIKKKNPEVLKNWHDSFILPVQNISVNINIFSEIHKVYRSITGISTLTDHAHDLSLAKDEYPDYQGALYILTPKIDDKQLTKTRLFLDREGIEHHCSANPEELSHLMIEGIYV